VPRHRPGDVGHEGDRDLVVHFATTRSRGVAVFGPPAVDVIAPVGRSALLRSFAEDLTWGLDRSHAVYAVLNACRALRSARDGGMYSKLEGGWWAIEQGVGERGLIEAAIRQHEGSDAAVDVTAATPFVTEVREMLVSMAARDD
jgi:hypothetical protein